MRRVLAAAVLLCTACASPWSLRYKAGTAFNLYDSARYDEKRACEGPTSQSKPDWCGPCQSALNRHLDAVELAQAAAKRPGKAPWQKKRLKKTTPAVESACPKP